MSQIAVSFTSANIAGDPVVNFGWTFSLSASVTVVGLGAYQVPGDSPAEVGIWDQSGTLLAFATVAGSDPVTDGFNFASIGSVTLPAGSYTIGEWFAPSPGGPIGYGATGFTTLIPELTYTGGAWASGSDFAEPVGDAFGGGLNPAYFGPNFEVLCLLAGTRILTPSGETPVETLRPGDLVVTMSGAQLPVRWVGKSVISSDHEDLRRALPIRIHKSALGPCLPKRDLLVSTNHGIFINDLLIHAAAMLNGTSITREYRQPLPFTYYHVELDTHSLLVAEGVAVESFLDGVEMIAFANWADRTPPVAVEELPYPRVRAVRQLPRAVRDQLAAYAATLQAEQRSVA